jgi:hypothetical protein
MFRADRTGERQARDSENWQVGANGRGGLGAREYFNEKKPKFQRFDTKIGREVHADE